MSRLDFLCRSVLLLVVSSTASLIPAGAFADAEVNENCLACHEFGEGDVITFGDGTERSVAFDIEEWERSVHHGVASCTDCHQGITDYPHPPAEYETSREYSLARGEAACKTCHYDYYTRMLDGMHYKVLQEGNRNAPTCIDCHGHHDIVEPGRPRGAIASRCGECHADVAAVYAESVHGLGVIGERQSDYPTCTDCHDAHAIKDPHSTDFHAAAHEICAPCHGDASRMARYGLNPNVVSTYLDDFHGRSNLMYQAGGGIPGQPMANCTDCHGFHDIRSFRGEESVAVVRERVVETCRQCHEGATPAFADSWLSHYEPSLTNAPMVWAVKWGYRFMIPFIMLALTIHIGMHLGRVRINRRRSCAGGGTQQ